MNASGVDYTVVWVDTLVSVRHDAMSHRRAPDGTVHVELSGRWILRTTRQRTVGLLSELAKAR